MSSILAVIVSAALALGPAPSRLPDRFEELEAHVQDLAGQKMYRDLALAGTAAFERRNLEPYQRRAMAFYAIRGLHGMFEETGQVASLCAAGRLMRRVQAEVGFAEDADAAARLKKATAKHLARTGATSPCSTKIPAKTSPPAVAAAPSPGAEGAAKVPSSSPAVHEAAADDDGLLAVAPAAEPRAGRDPKNMADKPGADVSHQPPQPRAPKPDRDETRSAKLMPAGLAFIALGTVAGVGLGVSLHYRGRASDTIDVLRANADMRGESTPEEYARARDLNESYRRLTVAAGVGGALAVAGVVGAVTLFALRARRGTTLAGPWIGPAGAGLSIRGHF